MSLFDHTLRLAHQNPDLRKHLLPLLRTRIARATCQELKGGDRQEYLDQVWSMYERTYRPIGLIVKNPQGLLSEFPLWELCLDEDGVPHAFNLAKQTSFGIKSGLSGHDGTTEGKALALNNLRTKYKRPGFYGEMSHKALEIALAAGAPVVCAAYAPQILGKPVETLDNGVSYRRNISGVGMVTKVLLGHPRGVPVTSWDHPQCPAGAAVQASVVAGEADDFGDLAAHYACLLDD